MFDRVAAILADEASAVSPSPLVDRDLVFELRAGCRVANHAQDTVFALLADDQGVPEGWRCFEKCRGACDPVMDQGEEGMTQLGNQPPMTPVSSSPWSNVRGDSFVASSVSRNQLSSPAMTSPIAKGTAISAARQPYIEIFNGILRPGIG